MGRGGEVVRRGWIESISPLRRSAATACGQSTSSVDSDTLLTASISPGRGGNDTYQFDSAPGAMPCSGARRAISVGAVRQRQVYGQTGGARGRVQRQARQAGAQGVAARGIEPLHAAQVPQVVALADKFGQRELRR